MTIAAGFKCSDGFVLCADTEITYADLYKESRAKLRASRLPNCDLYWAICGDVDFVNMLMGKIVEAVEECPNNMREIRAEIERICIEVSNAYPNYQQPQIPLLIHEPDTANIKLFKLSGPVVSPVSDSVCVGTGQPLASYLIGSIYRRTMTMKKVGVLATYALTHVKRHAFGCGGASQIVMIDNDGNITPFMTKGPGEHNPEQEDFEKYVIGLDRAIKGFAFGVIGERLNREEFEQHLQTLDNSLRGISEERLAKEEAERAILDSFIEDEDAGEEQKP
jgi:20S proteasome alpha/beta subunit